MDPRLVIIVPARGGSTRIPGKNIASLRGKPLLLYTLEHIDQAGLRDTAYVSTEDPAIRQVARDAGFAVLDRPPALATAAASTESVLLSALDILEGEGKAYDWVMTLPPTSPLRTGETIQRFVKEAEAAPADLDCLFSVTERLERFWKRDASGELSMIFPDAPVNQQDRWSKGLLLYEENSAVYLTRVKALREAAARGERAPIFGRRSRGIVIDAQEGIDINTSLDLRIADALMSGNDITLISHS